MDDQALIDAGVIDPPRTLRPGTLVKLKGGYYFECRNGERRVYRMPGLWEIRKIEGHYATVAEVSETVDGLTYGRTETVAVSGPTTVGVTGIVREPYRAVVPRNANKRNGRTAAELDRAAKRKARGKRGVK